MVKSTFGNGSHGVGEGHGGEAGASVKRIIVDGAQPCEVLQLVERGDGVVAYEHAAVGCPRRVQRRYCGGFFEAQLAVAVGVPVLHADGFHVGIGKRDVLREGQLHIGLGIHTDPICICSI